MKQKIIVSSMLAVFLITIPLYAVYHKITEKNLYYFTSCISMKDDIVFIGTDELYSNPLFVINVEDPYNPNIIGQYGGFGGIKEICVYDTVIYVAHGGSNLTIGNITDPGNVAMTECCSGITFHSIKTKNEYAFAGTDIGLIVLDIASPEQPVIIDTLNITGIERITLNQNDAYVLTDEGFYIIDISDPSNSVIEGMYQVDLLLPTGIAYHNNYVYVTTRNHILVFDVSYPQNPEFVFDKYHYGFPNDLYVNDSILYTCGSLYGFGAFDISDPLDVKLMNNYVAPREAVASCMDDDYVYVVDWAYGLQIIERNDSPNQYLIKNISQDSIIVSDFKLNGQYIYFADIFNGFGIFDCNDMSSNPIFPLGPSLAGEIALYGDYVYLSSSTWEAALPDGYMIINCEDPLSPELIGEYSCDDYGGLLVADGYMYRCILEHLKIFDLNNPENPEYLGNIHSYIDAYDVSDSLICFSKSYTNPAEIHLYNTYDYGSPQQISVLELQNHEIFELGIFDTIVLAAYYNESWYSSRSGFYVIDISDPQNPEMLDHIILNTDDYKMFFSGFRSIKFAKNNNTLVVADNANNRLITYDCTDFSNLQIKDEFWWNYKTTDLSFNGNDLITCNFGNGITIMDWTDNLDIDDPEVSTTDFNIKVFPNPITPSTNISFSVKERSKIKIDMYNIKGQKISSIIDNIYMPGEHTIELNVNSISNSDYSSGVYLIGFKKDGVVFDVQKVILLE